MSASGWSEAARYLSAAVRFGGQPGLNRMELLLDRLGHPERSIPRIVHVGGTNGKGSVTAYIAESLSEAGFRVARYTSPHLVHYCERITVEGQAIPPRMLAQLLLEVVRPAANQVAEACGEYPTLFELLTATMYLWCRQQRVDWLVQEVGLGGRLDPTNVITQPTLVVLTNVSLDHTERLGTTVSAIAAEKAGIIKPGCPVVTAATGHALRVFAERARRVGATLIRVAGSGREPRDADYVYAVEATTLAGSSFRLAAPGGRCLSLRNAIPGQHQVENAALAAAAVDQLWDGKGARDAWEQVIARGLARARWPGRMDLLPTDPPVLVDGAHNPAAMRALAQAVDDLFPGRPLVLLVALTGSRRPAAVFGPWLRRATRVRCWVAVPMGHPGGWPQAERLAGELRAAGAAWVRALPSVAEGLAVARAEARRHRGPDGAPALVLTCGSLHLAGAVLALLGQHAPFSLAERTTSTVGAEG